MKRLFLIFTLALSAAGPVRADDKHDTDLIPADFEVLSGTYTNVREFKVLTGRTVFVGQATGLYIYAGTVTIQGVLNADGRGYAGGANGANVGTGFPGGQGFGPGPGAGGAAQRGGGGGGYGDADGIAPSGGAGNSGGAGGAEYNSTTTISIPLSAVDIFMGSGGGGGGGGDSVNTVSGAGGGGGGLIYLEANYVTVAGTITANGLDGGAGLDTADCTTSPGGGGGGAGGGILIRAVKDLSLSNAVLSAKGGLGGTTICLIGSSGYAGGGGAGGRIKLVYNSTAAFTAVTISTAAGKGGEKGIGNGFAQSGSSGTVSYGILPSSPTGLALTNVFTSSITYSWTSKTSGWGSTISMLPALTTWQFRLYESTSAAPLSDFYRGVAVSSGATAASETGLFPNTTYYRFITAYTDYGDGMPSGTVSTHTFAAAPQAAAGSAFPSTAADSITFTWSSGTAASGFNPAYTAYEVSRSTYGDFSTAVSTMEITAISSAPAGLAIDTTYYFRVRAHGLNTAYTAFTTVLSTATLCVPPGSGDFTAVNVDSFTFAWSSGTAAGGFNPAWTLYDAQISVDSFLTVFDSTRTTALNMPFAGLSPGTFYSARARAVNSNGTPTDFTLSVATAPGNLTNLEAPGRPEPPAPTSKFSYNGSATFTWYPPSGPVQLYRYWLEIGTTPNGNDFLSSSSVPATTLSYLAGGLLTDRTYYARVRAESMAGVLGEFSTAGPGVVVWIASTVNPISKPYNWPNPFDPAAGATNIGFNLAAPAQVTLKIFTLQGALVYEASGNEASGGNKIWQWTGRNGRGSMVEPGGYVGLIIKRYGGGTDSQKFKMAVLY